MDTSAYLTRHGWRGHGYSLDARGQGIRKPLLVSKKNNTYGVGKRQHEVLANQWWNSAFEKCLKDINIGIATGKPKSSSKENSIQDAVRPPANSLVTKWGQLYGGFVKGDTLCGSFKEEIPTPAVEALKDSSLTTPTKVRRKQSKSDQVSNSTVCSDDTSEMRVPHSVTKRQSRKKSNKQGAQSAIKPAGRSPLDPNASEAPAARKSKKRRREKRLSA